MADFETKLRWLSERGNPVGAEELIERIEAEMAGDPLVVVAKRQERTLMTKTQQSPRTDQPSRFKGPASAVTAFVAVLVAAAGLYLAFSTDRDEVADTPTPPTTVAPDVETMTDLEAEVTELLNGFIEARVAGEAVQQYLFDMPEEDIPLLYATSSGAPYERAEFEQVLGIEWPYGFIAFKVRLFAGDTVVEQLFFLPHDDPEHFPADGRPRLEYNPHGFGTAIAPTTEDGRPVAVPVNSIDGEMTLHAAHPWIFADYPFGRLGHLIPAGSDVGPTTDGGERSDWDEFRVMADPAADERGCQTASPGDAQALAESIRSYPGIEATAPVVVRAGGAEALMFDVVIAAGATMRVAVDEQGNLCEQGVLNPIFDQQQMASVDIGVVEGQATGERMRLYLFDMPEGSSIRTMAIAIIAPESSFERAVEAAAPVVDSVEFHAP